MEIVLIIILIILYLEFRPVKRLYLKGEFKPVVEGSIKELNKYRIISHVHTQFSFDSLGKPSDIKKAVEENRIDFVFITDHDNEDYRYFEDKKIFAGLEVNTPEGRMLFLGGKLPVISHPNNFEFDHYVWKGEFKKEYLYELINIKDAVVWKKSLSIIYLLKNILIYPLTRKILHKWNVLVPLEQWVKLYYSRARGLKIIGGLDLHVKLVYQEHTHGILIPSYREGFKWLVNIGYSKEKIETKDDALNLLKEGKVFLSMKDTDADFWGFDGENVYTFWEKMPLRSYLNCRVNKPKTVKILKWENNPVVITEEHQFSYKVEDEGLYHFEVYEYDFKIGDRYIGFRPLIITNMFEVVDGRKENNT